MQVRPLRASLLALVLLTACGTPPHKEIDQAQGAIDAARAAGADRLATEEFNAATTSLKLANEAVDQRDYRLALNHALESREHAQNAARLAAETHGRLRGDVERSMAEVTALIAQANGRLATAERTARVARRVVADTRKSLATVNSDVQKAGAAVQAQDFSAAQALLSGAKQRILQVIARLDNVLRAQNTRRRG
jgi:hypothetical protein